MRIAYLASIYARASDTAIRGEIAQVRALGHTVYTFSIRRPGPEELVSDDVRRERAATEDILEAGVVRLFLSTLSVLLKSPGRFLSAVLLTWKISVPGLKGRLMPLAYLIEACYLAGRLQEKDIEHLHNHIGRNSAVVAMLASTLTKIPYSLTIHGPTEFDEPQALSLGVKIGRSKFTVAISEYGRSQLCRWTKFSDWSKIRVVRCGVEPGFLSAPPMPIPDVARFVFVGRLAEQKGAFVLIEAAARLREKGLSFELCLIGDGPMRSEIERLITEYGLVNHCKLIGWRNAADVRSEIQSSRVLVMASFAEGLPAVLFESMALGRPVVATYVAGIPELVRDGVNGWLVPPGDATALTDAMAEAIETPLERLAVMGQSGIEAVRAKHDARREAEKLVGLFCGA